MGSSTGNPLRRDVSLASTVVGVDVEVVDDVEVEEVVEEGAAVVDDSAGYSAAPLQAARSRETATNLATVVRIQTILRSGPRLAGITQDATRHVEVGERRLGLIDRDSQLDPV